MPLIIVAVLVALGIVAFNVWVAVIMVQFLRTGTQAFRRYVALTSAPQQQGPRQPGPYQTQDLPPGYP